MAKFAVYIRTFTVIGIVASIATVYYVMIVQKDYEVLTNPDGPDTSDYFEE
jgi:hypothetical protein